MSGASGADNRARITFVVAFSDDARSHVLTSPIRQDTNHQWIVLPRRNYPNLSCLYNDAIERAQNDLVFFLHPRAYLPESWQDQILDALDALERVDHEWALVSTLGTVRPGPATRYALIGHAHSPAGYVHTPPLPRGVEAVDDRCMGIRRSSGLSFDPDLPGFDHHGMDISLTARRGGLTPYVVDACMWLDRDEVKAEEEKHKHVLAKLRSAVYVRQKWIDWLPFASPLEIWNDAVPRPQITAEERPDFSRLRWDEKGIAIADIRLRTLDAPVPPAPADGVMPPIYKPRALFGEYEKFWEGVPDFAPKNIVELGAFEGGSAVFWNELLRPKKLVVVDLRKEADVLKPHARFLKEYIERKRLEERLRFYWETNQSDEGKLLKIARDEFAGALDFVIDDASHAYDATKRSFETLFPLLRDGGWYMIEDWNWQIVPRLPDDAALPHVPLVRLVFELVELSGRENKLIRTARTVDGLAFFERGHAVVDRTFRVADYLPS